MEGIIYKYTNSVNGMCYIGQTINEEQRMRRHFYEASRESRIKGKFHKALHDYGPDAFVYEKVEIIYSDSKERLKELLDIAEAKYIKLFDSYNNGYNSTEDGQCPVSLITNYHKRNRKKKSKRIKEDECEVYELPSPEEQFKQFCERTGMAYSNNTLTSSK